MKNIKEYLRLFRIKHYIKNMLIFVPLLFTDKFFTMSFLPLCYGFVSFSMMASVVYIINDLKDIDRDKLHETKKFRPIASGKIKKRKAIFLIILLFILSLLFNYLAVGKNIDVFLILFLYIIVNLMYSFKLKNVPIIDIFLMAIFYIIRVYYGAALVNVPVSNWLYLTILSAALYLAFGKRRNELKQAKNNTRDVLKYYNKDFLDKFMYVSLSLTLVFYSLWVINQNIRNLVITIPLVFMIFMKYSLDVEGNSDGDPTEVLFKDKFLIYLVLLYGILLLYIRLKG